MDEVIQRLWDIADNSPDNLYKQGVMDALKIVLEKRQHECEQRIDELEYKLWISNFANLIGDTDPIKTCCNEYIHT